jgi:hypothetical protein
MELPIGVREANYPELIAAFRFPEDAVEYISNVLHGNYDNYDTVYVVIERSDTDSMGEILMQVSFEE